MIRVFKKRFPNAQVTVNSGSDLRILMDFAESDLGTKADGK
jgi:hypothetical protein